MKRAPARLKSHRNLPSLKDLKSQRRAVGLVSYNSHCSLHLSGEFHPPVQNSSFPSLVSVKTFPRSNQNELERWAVTSNNPEKPLIVETAASNTAVSAILTQTSRLKTFFRRIPSRIERHHSLVGKAALSSKP